MVYLTLIMATITVLIILDLENDPPKYNEEILESGIAPSLLISSFWCFDLKIRPEQVPQSILR